MNQHRYQDLFSSFLVGQDMVREMVGHFQPQQKQREQVLGMVGHEQQQLFNEPSRHLPSLIP